MNRLLLVLAIAGVMFSGCVEEKQEYVLNPDGSGKVIYEVNVMPVQTFMSNENSNLKISVPKKKAREGAAKIINDSTGVEVWKDISYEYTDEGKIHFEGTAYFRDVNELGLAYPNFDKTNETKMKLSKCKDQPGNKVLTFGSQTTATCDEPREKREFTESELAEEVKKTRIKYNQGKASMAAILSNMRIEKIFHFPGGIQEVSQFKKVGENTVRLVFDGDEFLSEMDKMMQDEELLKEYIRENMGSSENERFNSLLLLNDSLSDEDGPIRVVFQNDSEDCFDYQAEVADAKEKYAKMLKTAGLQNLVSSSSDEGQISTGGWNSIKDANQLNQKENEVVVCGAKMIWEDGGGVFRFDKGYSIYMSMKLPVKATAANKGKLTKAVADTGESLLGRSWTRGISIRNLSEDKRTCGFEVKLQYPEGDIKGIKELSGYIEYTTAGGIKKLDSGLIDFKEGVESEECRFSISDIDETHSYEGGKSEEMQLKMGDIERGIIKETKFYDENGNEIKNVHMSGSMSCNGILSTLSFKSRNGFGERGRIVFEVYDKTQKRRANFKVTNISLMGGPLE